MKENSIFFQIKAFDKMIFRMLNNDFECGINTFFDRKSLPTPTQMQIMHYILDHDGEDVYQRDLEKVLNLRRATVSGVLQTMEKNNLIERVVDSEDTRTKKIILNDKAKSFFLENKDKLKKLEKIALQDISKDDLKVFENVLEKMKENLKKSK